MRLFIAVPLPDDIRNSLHLLGMTIQGARAVPADQIHLTLRFIGETDSSTMLDIADTLHTVIFRPFSLSLKGTGHFPPRKKPQVIWTGIAETPHLFTLKKNIDRALARCGIAAERRKFSPHVTIARCKTTSLDRAVQFLSVNSLFISRVFTCNQFNLYTSTLSAKGATHTINASYAARPNQSPLTGCKK